MTPVYTHLIKALPFDFETTTPQVSKPPTAVDVQPPARMSSQPANPFTTTLVSVNLFQLALHQPTCPIFRLNFIDPVVMPCHASHQYCRSCIVSWLNEAGPDASCPICRAAFVASVDIPDLSRLQQVQLALQISGLQFTRDPEAQTQANIFGFDGLAPGMSVFRNGAISDTATLAVRYLAQADSGSFPHAISGLGYSDADKLLVHLLVMAKLLKALAAVQRNGFISADTRDWCLIVALIGKGICARHGKSKDVSKFRRRLRRRIDFNKSTRGLEFLQEPWTGVLVDELLDYVVIVARKEAQRCNIQTVSTKVKQQAVRATRRGVVAMEGCQFM